MAEKSTIAIIDDDKIFHVLTRRILEKVLAGDNILEFYDGQEALSYIQENQHDSQKLPDLILLDIQMPYVDGWQFLDRYSELEMPKAIAIYIVSSSISSSDHEKAQQYKNLKGFVVKPFTREKILAILEEFSKQTKQPS